MVNSSSSVSSFSSSSSLLNNDEECRKKKRRKTRGHGGDDNERCNNNKTNTAASTIIAPSTAAPSDYDELRAHYQFVLPTDNDDDANNNGNNDNNQRRSTTWQQRMVQHYHNHLYKEFVLADLSKVYDNGKIGLRWRTSNEVANGRGFRCCGNLMCDSNKRGSHSASANHTAGDREDDTWVLLCLKMEERNHWVYYYQPQLQHILIHSTLGVIKMMMLVHWKDICNLVQKSKDK